MTATQPSGLGGLGEAAGRPVGSCKLGERPDSLLQACSHMPLIKPEKRRINGLSGPQTVERGPRPTFSAFGDPRASEAPQWQFLSSRTKPSVPIAAFPSPIGAAVPLRREFGRAHTGPPGAGGGIQAESECCCRWICDRKPAARATGSGAIPSAGTCGPLAGCGPAGWRPPTGGPQRSRGPGC